MQERPIYVRESKLIEDHIRNSKGPCSWPLGHAPGKLPETAWAGREEGRGG